MASEEDGRVPTEPPAKKQRFYFESDMLALKSNPDYQKLLKSLAILEAQKIQSIKDLEALSRAQVRADRDPQGFVQELRAGTLEPLPTRQKIAEVPEIDWKPYIDSLQAVARQQSDLYRRTRKTNNKTVVTTEKTAQPGGKIKEADRPASYRQAWSQEEQAKFEELLQIYPPEHVEMRRFEKIAAALKTRTPQQVASHVQKYFIKLARAGLPVPGRMPSTANYSGKPKKSGRAKRSLSRPSTFFAGLTPRVYMAENSGASTPSYEDSLCEGDSSDDDSVVAEWVPVDPPAPEDDSEPVLAVKCSSCGEEVNAGAVFWECSGCPEDHLTRLCRDCVNCDYRSAVHSPSHDVQPCSVAGPAFSDSSYTGFTPQLQLTRPAAQADSQCMHPAISYNYLDPNFYPAL